MLLLETLCLLAVAHVSYVDAMTNIRSTRYCAFDAKIAPSDDPMSLDITYAPTTTPINSYMFDGKACLLEIDFTSSVPRGDVYMEEIEYTSNKKMDIETKVAWKVNFGPTLYDTVSVPVSKTESVVARNTTFASFPFCVQQAHSSTDRSLFIQTKFSDADVGANFQLVQKARLRYSESELCTVRAECDQPDIDQKFPPCHGVPGGDFYEYNGM